MLLKSNDCTESIDTHYFPIVCQMKLTLIDKYDSRTHDFLLLLFTLNSTNGSLFIHMCSFIWLFQYLIAIILSSLPSLLHLVTLLTVSTWSYLVNNDQLYHASLIPWDAYYSGLLIIIFFFLINYRTAYPTGVSYILTS